MQTTLKCIMCEEEIPAAVQSYGSIYQPHCQKCEDEMAAEMSQPSYGFFVGGDPRKFKPDPESSYMHERENHRLDCEAWERGEYIRSGSYGLGVNNG